MTLRKDCYCYLWYLKPSLFSLGMLFVSASSPTWAVSWHQWWAALKCHKVKAVCVLVVQVKDTCWAEFTAPLAIMLLSSLSGVFSKDHSRFRWLSFIYQLYSDCSKSASYLAKGFTRNAIHPNSGIETGSPALQADSIPTELPGKLPLLLSSCHFLSVSVIVLVLHISQLSCSAQKT